MFILATVKNYLFNKLMINISTIADTNYGGHKTSTILLGVISRGAIRARLSFGNFKNVFTGITR